MAKAIGGLDIGQTVVVKNLAVMAAEAIEGTDEAILRGGSLGRNGCTVVKVAKPEQDLRFDVPCIGPDTIETAASSSVSAIIVEANKTLLLGKNEIEISAERNGVTVYAYKE